MERFKRQAVLLDLLDVMKERGSWCGETHVQKCAHFLEVGLAVPLQLGFVLYKHGPFSFELREVLGEMRANLLIDVESRRPYGPSLVVSDSGRAMINRFPKTTEQYARHIAVVADWLSTRTVAELERLSTALHVMKQTPDLSSEERASQIIQLKSHITPEQAHQAVDEVGKLIANAQAALHLDDAITR